MTAERNVPNVAYTQSSQQILASLGVDGDRGLSLTEATQRLARNGPNALAEAPPEPLWHKLLAQFRDLVIWILVAAALISGVLGEWVDALAILAIVLLNGVIGFLQEARAERALAALQRLSAPTARALRDGVLTTLAARELVPGDVLDLEAGDCVPADARLLRAYAMTVQESALTGESLPVEKSATALLPDRTPLGDRQNMVYSGTIVSAGKARAVVVATGPATELGRISDLLQRHEPDPTPLQRRLAELGRILIVVCLAITSVVFVLQWLRDGSFAQAFLISVSLAVAAVPEGLPAVVTIALALGLQRMVRRNALVRRLPSVETLGSVTVICSDKTGTLTRNEMTVREIYVGGLHYQVSGSGYSPRGEFLIERAGGIINEAQPAKDGELQRVLSIGVACNNAQLLPPIHGDGAWRIVGDPTEGALLVVARKAEIGVASTTGEVVFEIPFESSRKLMSTVRRDSDGDLWLYTKGAPEAVLPHCIAESRDGSSQPIDDERRRAILAANTQMANRALRVLALAYREQPSETMNSEIESELVFAGLVGMMDPPREEAKAAVVTCRKAGIRPVMITGDHPATAAAIARELGMMAASDRVLSGVELDGLSNEDLVGQVEHVAVYARATAEHKLRIVKAWKSKGQVVAMTGDGVNDAPAIKAADIGIAMGVAGTDVTKEASDMVLTDDNFASIVSAVEEGRGIFDNIQKVLQFLLSCNLGEILLMFVSSLLGWPTPLLPVQLLWINLVTDGLPALALSLEPPDPDIMARRPRRPDESILSARLGLAILVQGVLIGGVGLAAFAFAYLGPEANVEHARAMTFCVVVYAELFRSFASRSYTRTLFQLGVFTNPALLLAVVVSGLLQLGIVVIPLSARIFDVPAHTPAEWTIIAILALTPATVLEVLKLVWLRRSAPRFYSSPTAAGQGV
ncbi:MAG: cation-translocating P-type ATPase [Pirellulales bacterium]|nr:cation-translocating P-type ATPase [Pirellulales bacterium]